MKLERATLNRDRNYHGGGAMSLFAAESRLMKAGAYACACGEPATRRRTSNGRVVRCCALCADIARQKRQIDRMCGRW
jgi:hypothetical protein